MHYDSECSDSSTIQNSSDKDNSDDILEILPAIQNIDICKQHTPKKDVSEMAKVVVRRLPPNMTKDLFLKAIEPVPEYDYLYFVKPDGCNAPHLFSRVYINFKDSEDIFDFKEKFDNYVFLDQKGAEYPAVVEYSNFQRIPKKRAGRKKDPKVGTIDSDPTYKEFLETYSRPAETEVKVDYGYKFEAKKVLSSTGLTPLVEYVQQKRLREQKGRYKDDQRRIRDSDRKRIREDERKRKRLVDKTKKEQSVSFGKNREGESHRKDRLDSSSVVRKSFLSDTSKKTSTPGGFPSKGNENLSNSNRKQYGETPKKVSPGRQQSKGNDLRRSVGDKSDNEKQEKFSGVRRHDWENKQNQNFNYKQSNRYESHVKKSGLATKETNKSFNSQQLGKNVVSSSPTKLKQSFSIPDVEIEEKVSEDHSVSVSPRDQLKLKYEKMTNSSRTTEDHKKDDCDDEIESIVDKVNKESKTELNKSDDSRKQKPIRNKDRPDLQIYRPGMGRFSKDRICQIIDSGTKADSDKDTCERDTSSSEPSYSNSKSKVLYKKILSSDSNLPENGNTGPSTET